MTPRARIVAALAITLTTLVSGTAAAQPKESKRDARAVAESWTAARRGGAKPRDIVVEPRAKPGGGGGTGTARVTGASWPNASTDPVERSVAKVFFTLGGVDYVCSASTVEPAANVVANRSVVLTAGHCVWDDAAGYATEFLIVPNYDVFVGDTCSLDVNCWVGVSFHASSGWRAGGDDFVHDFAFVAFNGSLATAVGDDATVPIRLGLAPPTAVHAFGYPASKKYSGHDLVYCAGATVRGPGSYSANVGVACDQTGGSSGGPWYADFAGQRAAVSLNSFGLRGYTGYMYGPVFDAQAAAALAAASS